MEFLHRSPQAQELGNNKLKVDKKKPAFAKASGTLGGVSPT